MLTCALWGRIFRPRFFSARYATCCDALFREAVEQVHADQPDGRRAQGSEPSRVDRLDLARAVDLRDHTIDEEAPVLIALFQHHGYGIVVNVLPVHDHAISTVSLP